MKRMKIMMMFGKETSKRRSKREDDDSARDVYIGMVKVSGGMKWGLGDLRCGYT